MESFIFDFHKCNRFFEDFNIMFEVADMDGATSNFKIFLLSDCADDFTDIVNSDGILKRSDCVIAFEEDCKLLWDKLDSDTADIKLAEDVKYNIGEDLVPIRALLVATSDDYVIGYSINNVPISMTNSVVVEKDLIFCTVGDGVYGDV